MPYPAMLGFQAYCLEPPDRYRASHTPRYKSDSPPLGSHPIRKFILPAAYSPYRFEKLMATLVSEINSNHSPLIPSTELYSYLRSPYRDLTAYDNNVQVRNFSPISFRRRSGSSSPQSMMCPSIFRRPTLPSADDGGNHVHPPRRGLGLARGLERAHPFIHPRLADDRRGPRRGLGVAHAGPIAFSTYARHTDREPQIRLALVNADITMKKTAAARYDALVLLAPDQENRTPRLLRLSVAAPATQYTIIHNRPVTGLKGRGRGVQTIIAQAPRPLFLPQARRTPRL